MTARLFRVILPVRDIEKAAAFYESILKMKGQRVSRGRHYLNCGGTILALLDSQADGEKRPTSPNPEHIYFAVSDLEGACKLVASGGGKIEGEIATMPWGERMFYFVDPFGNKVSFVDEKTLFTGGAFVD